MQGNRIGFFSTILFSLIVAACGEGGQPAPADETVGQMSDADVMTKAEELHASIMTLDTHVDIPPNYATAEADPGVRGDAQVDIPKMLEGGLDTAFFIVYVGQTERTPENYEKAKADAMIKFDAIHRMTDDMYPDKIVLVDTADEADAAWKNGKLAAFIGIENGYVIGKDLSLLEKYRDLGARYITLAHNGHNDIADSAQANKDFGDADSEHNGISDFGAEVIAEMNRVGIVVDISHVSKAAMMEATALSKSPVMASHSGARALNDHPRNMDDEQLRAVKENGGVVQAVALGAFVRADPPEKTAAIEAMQEEMGVTRIMLFTGEASEEQAAEFRRRMEEIHATWPRANVSDYVNHIDHMVEVMGIDHVGISSDFDGGGGVVGWDDASETLNVTAELVRRGYSDEDIAKIWSGNTLRVLRENERTAAELQAAQQ